MAFKLNIAIIEKYCDGGLRKQNKKQPEHKI